MRRDLIFGVDIFKGSPRSKTQQKYALAIFEGGKDVKKYERISRFKLIRMVKERYPEILAVDNIYELLKDRKELLAFLKKLPYETKLVQVTEKEGLSKLAARYNISFNKRSPLESAMVCACLAKMGIGREVSYISDRTKIRVSRARSLGKGGWSQNRYKRKVHGMVKLKIREIKGYLDKRGVDYGLSIKKGFGGYRSGSFIVEDNIKNLSISSKRGCDVQVKISPITKDAMEFSKFSRGQRYIIVGIDPGTTSAIAILDLGGNVLRLSSSRNSSLSDMIRSISNEGTPVIVATDVYPVPSTVEKVKRDFNAIIHSSDDTPTDYKMDITRGYDCSNVHERDALFAALDAYKKFKNKFEKIEKETPIWIDSDDIKAAVLKGSSLKSAIHLHSPKKEDLEEKEEKSEETKEKEKDLQSIKEQIQQIREHNNYLKSTIEEKDEEIKGLKKYIERLKEGERRGIKREREIIIREKEIKRQGKEIFKLKKKIKSLSEQIDLYRKIKILESSGRFYPVKVIGNFNRDSILEFNNKMGIKSGDIVYLKDATGGGRFTADILIGFGIRAVMAGSKMSHMAKERFYKMGIPVFSAEEVVIKVSQRSLIFERVEDFGIIDRTDFDGMIDEWKEKNREEEERRKIEAIKNMMHEYKRERVI